MKRLNWILAAATGALLLTQPLHSQTARPVKSTLQQLQEMKAVNQKLIEQQAATLLKLEEMQKEAAQLRILVRRT